MNTLDEAWSWYESTRVSLKLIHRLGSQYWTELPWSGALGGDERFKLLDGLVVVEKSELALQHLDDLAVVVIFSVFESIVRERVLTQLSNERININNPRIQAIVKLACDRIEKGDFSLILDIYKSANVNLNELVDQVRKYRNWVAHGRRPPNPPSVTPLAAFNRLRVCLTFLGVLGGLGDGLTSFLGGNARDRVRTGCPTPRTMKRKSKHPKNPQAHPRLNRFLEVLEFD